MAKQDCDNANIIKKDIDTVIVLKNKNKENNPQAGLNISILPCF